MPVRTDVDAGTQPENTAKTEQPCSYVSAGVKVEHDVGMQGMPAIAERSSGYPGSADRYAAEYGVLFFATGCVLTWSVANNFAIFAEVKTLSSHDLW